MKIVITVFLASLCLVTTTYSQNTLLLEVGKPFPYHGNKSLTETIKGKKVILDLFSSNCIVCFQSLPKIQALKEAFDTKLDFVLIGNEDGEIQKDYQRFQKALKLQLPVFFDSSFFRIFNIEIVPKYIWLDADGSIYAITDNRELTADKLNAFIDGRINESSLAANEKIVGVPDSGLIFTSALINSAPNSQTVLPPSLRFGTSTKKFKVAKVTVEKLYFYAFFKKAWWNESDSMYTSYYRKPLLTNSKNPLNPQMFDWSFEGSKFVNEEILQEKLKSDLDVYFGYKPMIVEMEMPCWKLIVLPGMKEKLRSRGGPTKHVGNYGYRELANVPVLELIRLLRFSSENDEIFLDETDIEFNIDIKIEAPLTIPSLLYSELEKKGLKVVEGKKLMKVLVLLD